MQYVEKMLQVLCTIAEGLAQTFGKNCEVVVHDLRNLDRSIIKIVNGHVTGRKVGGSITDFGLKHLQLQSETHKALFINYPSATKNGKPLKSTTICVSDEKGNPIAGLCINLDVSSVFASRDFLEEICKIDTPRQDGHTETFHSDVRNTLMEIVKNTMEHFNKDVNDMNRNDKLKIIESLDQQ
jgi:predicted transcriptional regulator YheO